MVFVLLKMLIGIEKCKKLSIANDILKNAPFVSSAVIANGLALNGAKPLPGSAAILDPVHVWRVQIWRVHI